MSSPHAARDAGAPVAHQFDSLPQQKAAVSLGMWVFLAQEVMFFGGLFMAYVYYRSRFHEAFVESSLHLDVKLGALNTAVLIGSSLTMALAVRAAERGHNAGVRNFVLLTMLLGSVFLGVKAYEYWHKWHEHLIPGAAFAFEGVHVRGSHIFFILYFIMTGMHALHMVIGMGLMIALLRWNARGGVSRAYPSRVEVLGLYWHFVDIVWIFLFPMLYLISRH